jgi:hypothetical protein
MISKCNLFPKVLLTVFWKVAGEYESATHVKQP